MAVMTDAERKSVWGGFMEVTSGFRESVAITKPQLRAAVDALDDWIESQRTAINSAIPQPARGSLSSAQKERLFLYVVARKVVN